MVQEACWVRPGPYVVSQARDSTFDAAVRHQLSAERREAQLSYHTHPASTTRNSGADSMSGCVFQNSGSMLRRACLCSSKQGIMSRTWPHIRVRSLEFSSLLNTDQKRRPRARLFLALSGGGGTNQRIRWLYDPCCGVLCHSWPTTYLR